MAEINSAILCDTNVIIEIFKGNNDTFRILEKTGFENIYISSITVMEMFYGALNSIELKKIKRYLNSLRILQTDENISRISIELIEKYSKSHGLQIPDAVIAATSLSRRIRLFTYNIKDFKFIKDIKLYLPQ